MPVPKPLEQKQATRPGESRAFKRRKRAPVEPGDVRLWWQDFFGAVLFAVLLIGMLTLMQCVDVAAAGVAVYCANCFELCDWDVQEGNALSHCCESGVYPTREDAVDNYEREDAGFDTLPCLTPEELSE